MLPRLAKLIDRGMAALLSFLLVAMVLTVSWQVLSRYGLNDPSGWTEELARFLLIWIGLFGASFAYQRRLHLGFDLLAERLQGTARIWQRRCIDFGVLLFAATVLIGGGSSLVALTLELEQFSPALGLPMSLVYSSLPLTGILMAISALASLSESSQLQPGTD